MATHYHCQRGIKIKATPADAGKQGIWEEMIWDNFSI